MFGNNLGHVEIPLLSLWEGIHTGDQSKASSFHLQETHGRDFPKDPEIDCQKLSIPAI